MSEQDNPQFSSQQPVFEGGAPQKSSRKGLVITLLIITALAVAGAIYYLVLQPNNDSSDFSAANATEEIEEEAGVVEIRSDGIWPQTIKVKAGQQVTFINKDASPHRLTANQEELKDFDSDDMLSKDDSYTYVFDTPGRYTYYDPADGVKFSAFVEVN